MDQEWEKRLRARMDEMGFTMKSLSIASGLNDSYVRDMLMRNRTPTIDKLRKLAHTLGMSVGEMMGEDAELHSHSSVPLMGFVGAGAEVEPEFEQVPETGLERIDVPFPLPSDMIAFQVRGDSMLPQFRDGAVIIVYREQRRSIESFYGEEAAVRTADGRRFIKTIIRGQASGRVNLISWNASPIENVQLAWVGEIFSVFPARSLHRAVKQGGIQGALRLKSA